MLGPRGTVVTRTLPHRDRRMVGAWCFVDQYGPEDIAGRPGMRVPPHPHRWNFVGRRHDEIVQAREDWTAGRRFGPVHGYRGDPLPAPPMPNAPLKPRGRHR